VGLVAIFIPAPITFVGAVPPAGVAAANSAPHGDPSPADPPAEFVHVASTSAKVLISVTGTVVPLGTLRPGTVPLEVSAYASASVKALASAGASEGLDPTAEDELIKGASGQMAATVVSSLITMTVEALRLPQGPSAAIKESEGLLIPAGRPGFPPLPVM